MYFDEDDKRPKWDRPAIDYWDDDAAGDEVIVAYNCAPSPQYSCWPYSGGCMPRRHCWPYSSCMPRRQCWPYSGGCMPRRHCWPHSSCWPRR